MKNERGFTLTEVVITVAIVAILASIAYPTYTEQMRKTRRSDAKAALMKTAQILERCYTEYNAYNDTNCPVLADATTLASDYTSSEQNYYTISVSGLTATAFTLQAAPTGLQASDKCGTFTYDHVGSKGIADAASGVTKDQCW